MVTFPWRIGDQEQARTMADHLILYPVCSVESKDSPLSCSLSRLTGADSNRVEMPNRRHDRAVQTESQEFLP